MNWIQALKKWNTEKNTGKWKIPKKGTTEYNQVKSMMTTPTKTKATKPKRKYTKKPKTVNNIENIDVMI